MCQYAAGDDAVPNDWHTAHYGALATGGSGVVIVEATAVSPEGRITSRDLGLWNNQQRDAFKPITAFMRKQGVVPGIQIGHAGRKASTYAWWGVDGKSGSVPLTEGGWQTVAPSAIAFDDLAEPRELSIDEITEIQQKFIHSARLAVDAGFQAIEIHAAHGYLIHEFLSPLSNHRADEYGGALNNRSRLLLDVVRGIRAEIGDEILLFVRFSATDWVEGGWNEEETSIVADECRQAGADFFDISSGGVATGVTMTLTPGYQVPLSHYVKEHAHVLTGSVGLITEAHQADEIIRSGRSDVVFIGRESMRNPRFPLMAASILGVEIDYWPGQFIRAKPRT